MTDNDKGLDARVGRAARRRGLVARKSRWRPNSIDNIGGFQLINPQGNYCVAGRGSPCQRKTSSRFAQNKMAEHVDPN